MPKFTQEEIDSLNRLVSIKLLEPIINNLPKQKHWAQMGSLVKFTKHLRKKITPFLSNLFQKIESERILSSSICEASIILMPKLNKDTTKKENY